MYMTECQKQAWTKLPDVCQYEGKKTSWDKTAIFVSMETEKKPNQRTKLSQNRPQGLRMMTSD